MTVTNTAPPVITGTAKQGQTLHTSNGSWTYDLDILSYTYRWLRCDSAGANCIAIGGATTPGLLLSSADVGHRIRSEVTATEHTGTPLPPESGPITITTGGTYLVNVVSPNTTPAVTVNTTQPVTITGSVKNEHGGTLIYADQTPGSQITLDHLFIYGKVGAYATDGRAAMIFRPRSFACQNVTVEATRGIEITESTAAGTILITQSKFTNLQGNEAGPEVPANLVQLRNVTTAANIEVSWVEVIGEYGSSYCSDIISVFGSKGLQLHDFFFDGQWPQGNVANSQNTVTFESGSSNAHVWNGYMVGCRSVGLFGATGNIEVDHCRNVWTGLLPDSTTASYFSQPWFCPSGNGSGNNFHDNFSAYMNQGSLRTGDVSGASSSNMTTAGPPVTAAMEQTVRDDWATHKSGITIGA